MKAGLVMNAFVLAAYHRAGGAPIPLVGLFTSDEEIGSPACRPIIEETARGARAVLNSEPGRPSGNVVTGRKGGVFMHLEVLGKAAHSGGNYADGRSAIGELAHKILAFHAITDLDRGTTVNVGLISGGQSVNTVAPRATCEIDLRYVTPPDRAASMDRIAGIVATSTVPGTTAHLTIKGEFLPLVPDAASQALFETYARISAGQGQPVAGEFAGGCADFGFHRQRRLPDPLCGRTGRRQSPLPGGIPRGRKPRPPGARDGRDHRGALTFRDRSSAGPRLDPDRRAPKAVTDAAAVRPREGGSVRGSRPDGPLHAAEAGSGRARVDGGRSRRPVASR